MHVFSTRIYYEDTDAAGVVYYANYLKYAERARTEYLRDIGVFQSSMLEDGLGFVVRKCEVEYFSPARLDDEIEVKTSLQNIGKVRLNMNQSVYKANKQLVSLQVEIAMVDNNFRPAKIPLYITEKLKVTL